MIGFANVFWVPFWAHAVNASARDQPKALTPGAVLRVIRGDHARGATRSRSIEWRLTAKKGEATSSLLAQQNQRIDGESALRRNPRGHQPQQRHRQDGPAQKKRVARRRLIHNERQHLRCKKTQNQSSHGPRGQQLNARPSAVCKTSFRCAPKATRIPNSLSRLLTE